MRYALPLGLFVLIVILLAVGLELDPRRVPSPLIGKPLPAFEMETLEEPANTLSRADLDGRPYLLNVWASWCVACRQEHPLLVDLARRGTITLIGLNYKDTRADAAAWLADRGDRAARHARREAPCRAAAGGQPGAGVSGTLPP